ncbi:MAG TPA: peptidylprolyl isomerase [Nordella sp.]|nr:peptidylprolyl isomerase [Nordella sp.]
MKFKLGLAGLIAAVALGSLPLAAQELDPDNTLVIKTSGKCDITIKLRPDLAPKHVAQIKKLARAKYYDGVPFHRVIEGFMAQTGDGQNGDGTGGSNEPNVPAEFTNTHFSRGTVGMARTSDPNSANSQFFIMFGDGGFLDGQYTVFGEVAFGMPCVDKIAKGEPPAKPDKMVTVRLLKDVK